MKLIDGEVLIKWICEELKDSWLEQSKQRLGHSFWTGCTVTYERVYDKIHEMISELDKTDNEAY